MIKKVKCNSVLLPFPTFKFLFYDQHYYTWIIGLRGRFVTHSGSLDPWLDAPGSERTFSITMGVIIISYSLLTRYEWGLLRVIPFKIHLLIDFLSGLLLLSSMWMLGTKSWFFFAIGALTIIVTTLSGRRRFPKP